MTPSRNSAPLIFRLRAPTPACRSAGRRPDWARNLNDCYAKCAYLVNVPMAPATAPVVCLLSANCFFSLSL